jgi:hypothetical protein
MAFVAWPAMTTDYALAGWTAGGVGMASDCGRRLGGGSWSVRRVAYYYAFHSYALLHAIFIIG